MGRFSAPFQSKGDSGDFPAIKTQRWAGLRLKCLSGRLLLGNVSLCWHTRVSAFMCQVPLLHVPVDPQETHR